MLRSYFTILVFSVLFMAATCERPVDLSLETQRPSLVVISNFTDNQTLEVQVSQSSSVLSSGEALYVTDAQVDLFREDKLLETLRLEEPRLEKPFYKSDVLVPEVGVEYRLEVTAPGFEAVSARSRIPSRIDIKELKIENIEKEEDDRQRQKYSYDLILSFEDPGSDQNFYHLNFYQQVHQFDVNDRDTIFVKTNRSKIVFNNSVNNNYQIAHYDGGILLEDTPFNGTVQMYSFPVDVFFDPSYEMPGAVVAELRTVSEEYYLFHTSISKQQNNGDIPYSEPVIIFNNIENGQGVFAGYSHSVDSVGFQQ